MGKQITALFFVILLSSPVFCGEISADSASLHAHVRYISDVNPPRNITNINSLFKVANYIENQLRQYTSRIERQDYEVPEGPVRNLIASFGPENAPRIIVGAHYDVCGDQPGADDNASGVAGLLELARMLSQEQSKLSERIDLVAYTLEEPPYFKTEQMGSFIHAKAMNDQNVKIDLMISLEMIGFYSDDKDSQGYPIIFMKLFYPNKGDFISIVSNFRSRGVASDFVQEMKKGCSVPVERLTAPSFIEGIDFSDHLNYWHYGYKAIMITDTAFYRNKNYHSRSDTPETLNYPNMSEVVDGVYYAITHLQD
jgi:Zn-dependent M28 family amino/carboxypeptidase